jgi:cell division protein FtsB
MAWYNYRDATQKLSKLHERIEALSKEEKSLRNKVKRLNEKTGDFINVRGHPL